MLGAASDHPPVIDGRAGKVSDRGTTENVRGVIVNAHNDHNYMATGSGVTLISPSSSREGCAMATHSVLSVCVGNYRSGATDSRLRFEAMCSKCLPVITSRYVDNVKLSVVNTALFSVVIK